MSDENNSDIKKPVLNVPTDGGMEEVKKILDDTRTRKTIKLKSAPMPGAAAINPEAKVIPLKKPVLNQEKQEDLKTDSAPIVDPMGLRDTDTGGMKKLIDDTKTRKTVKLTPKVMQRPGINATDSTPISDPMSRRDTDTGDLNKLDIAQKQKTLNLNVAKPTLRPQAPESPKPEVETPEEEVLDTKTSAIKPVAAPKIQTPAPPPAAPQPEAADTKTSAIKIESKTSAIKPVAAPKIQTPAPPPAAPQPEVDDTKTSAVKMEDTKTAAVKMEKEPAAAADKLEVTSSDSSKTVGIKRSSIGMVPNIEENKENKISSPLPSVAAAKEVPDAAKTVRLRASAETEVPAPAPSAADDTNTQAAGKVAKLSKSDKSAKSTIKLKPSADSDEALTASNTVKIKAKAAAKPQAEAATVELKSPSEVKASARTVDLKASDNTALDAQLDKKEDADPRADTVLETSPEPESAKEVKPAAGGISLPKLKAMTPKKDEAKKEDAAEKQDAAEEQKEAGGGLKLKKVEKSGDGPKGPPRIQLDQEKIAAAGEQDASMPAIALSAVAAVAIGVSIFFSGSQYYELWGKALLAGTTSAQAVEAAQGAKADSGVDNEAAPAAGSEKTEKSAAKSPETTKSEPTSE